MSKKNDEKEEKDEQESSEGAHSESIEPEVLEFEFNDDGEEDLKKTLKKFRADLKASKAQSAEYLTGWQKERAEFANYKKGEEDRRAHLSAILKEDMLTRFLSVMDSFNMAFADREAWEKVDPNWRKGVEYIYAQMDNIFKEYDITPVGEVGEPFDPAMHQSMQMTPTDKKADDHKVSEVIQKGYKLGARVIRPARVNVFEYNDAK